MADAYEVNVAPHNFYGHLATMMNAHFCAVVPNFRIMEIDPDRVPWYDDLVTVTPTIEHGHLLLPAGPGWGTESTRRRCAPIRRAPRLPDPAGEARGRHGGGATDGAAGLARARSGSFGCAGRDLVDAAPRPGWVAGRRSKRTRGPRPYQRLDDSAHP